MEKDFFRRLRSSPEEMKVWNLIKKWCFCRTVSKYSHEDKYLRLHAKSWKKISRELDIVHIVKKNRFMQAATRGLLDKDQLKFCSILQKDHLTDSSQVTSTDDEEYIRFKEKKLN